jgi:kynurenine formamidase
MKIIDLSQKITNCMPVYPGDNEVLLIQDKHIEKDKYNNYSLNIGMHCGTHIDGPGHLSNDKRKITDFPLANFIGRGITIDVRGKNIINFEKSYNNIISDNDIVLFLTGQDTKWNHKDYYIQYPVFSEKLIDFLIEKNIKIFGIDSPSPDNFPFKLHKKFFNAGIFIIENLTNLKQILDKQFEVIALPLNIDADSSIIRVAARVF